MYSSPFQGRKKSKNNDIFISVENKLRIKSGIYDVLESGSVISVNEDPIEFYFKGLVFTFKFTHNTDISGSKVIATNRDDSKGISFEFINFNNPTGNGTKEPVLVGWADGRNLYLSYRISFKAIGYSRIIHYTWYLGGKHDAK